MEKGLSGIMSAFVGSLLVLLFLACAPGVEDGDRTSSSGVTSTERLAPAVEPAPEALAFLSAAIDTLQAIVLNADTIDWKLVRDSAALLAHGARSSAETYGALSWALGRVNRHSFLQAERPGAVVEELDGRIGYVRVPGRGGPGQALADSLHGAVGRLSDSGVCGWIVDLRANGGGNMWPMIAGIGPLLGDTVVGSFGAESDWYYRDGVSGVLGEDGGLDTLSRVRTSVVPPVATEVPVAVLFDEGTGSSGEAMVVAFHGRPNSRSFGTPTAGFATTNRGSRLPDGANMVVTVGYYRNRLGSRMGIRLEPDVAVAAVPTAWPYPTDRVASGAAEWLAEHPACTSPLERF